MSKQLQKQHDDSVEVHPREIDPKRLAEVANLVELDSVRVIELATKLVGAPSSPNAALVMEFEFAPRWRRADARPGIDVLFDFDCSLSERIEEKSHALFNFKIVLELKYRLPEKPPSDWDERFDQFAGVNGVVNAWPYVRSELQGMSARMQIPAIVLPVYRPGRQPKGKIEFRPELRPEGKKSSQ